MEIPGYYYDAAKKKYFKVESGSTALSTSYSSDAVKRRKIHDAARQEARLQAELVKRHIKRHGLQRNVISGGLLSREVECTRVAEDGRGRSFDEDIGAAAWAGGLQSKGRVRFMPSFGRGREVNMSCFWVGSTGVVYATLDEESLLGTHTSTDENDVLTFGTDPVTLERRRTPQFRTEMIRCPQMSSIKYHEPSHKMLLTSREPDHSCGLYLFSPLVSEEPRTRGQWLLGESDHYQRLAIHGRIRDEWLVHQSTPAPPSSDLLCVMGTNAGVVLVRSNDSMSRAAPAQPPKGTQLPQEIFDQDFQFSNHNVLLAGGRQPRLWTTDLRTPVTEWACARQPSAIAHLRSVNEHHVLTAGLQDKMGLYDMRFFKNGPNGTTPLLSFPGYKNAAHFHTGWDVSPELGVVAAAQDDGTVKLFSLHTGRALKSRALGAVSTDTPIRALMFHSMAGDRLPSLWVGQGQSLRKFSFGARAFNDQA
ncbi:WD40 domain protein [Metarhizium robertsii]|uniref:WD40 repeat-like-containing domain protein n=2 Tax=Metarhizium robertsii TaxID=568076 RepID=E9EPD1_METRA|nr:WD40 repeat-like-containing domain protein [Metarhizium robertsii ARSEF 23]EFZ02243.2 WD40 repeat-like-containing domain protein [Metarhizium robertsii ARSEF 23]EXV05416.1 WD40 domain protein [Metarhizium robertsii]